MKSINEIKTRIENEIVASGVGKGMTPGKLSDILKEILERTGIQDSAVGQVGLKELYESVLELQEELFPVQVDIKVTPRTYFKEGTSEWIQIEASMMRAGSVIEPRSLDILVGDTPYELGTKLEVKKACSIMLYADVQGMSVIREVPIKSMNPSFYGFLGEPENEILLGDLDWTWEGVCTENKPMRPYIKYPVELGNLASVQDRFGFETLPHWTKSEIRIKGNSYFYYIFEEPIVLDDFDFNFKGKEGGSL